jgi:hypothetical protein
LSKHVRDYNQEIVGDLTSSNASEIGDNSSISSDGTTLAIGWDYGENNITPGFVRVYRTVLSQWEQIGGDIMGNFVNDQFGVSVSLNNDGSTIACGALNMEITSGSTNGWGEKTGVIRVFDYRLVSQSEWDNGNVFGGSGTGVYNVFDGTKKIIIGENDATLDTSKYYWIQKGYDMYGNTNEYFGKEI